MWVKRIFTKMIPFITNTKNNKSITKHMMEIILKMKCLDKYREIGKKGKRNLMGITY
jgi:hypothetical protein